MHSGLQRPYPPGAEGRALGVDLNRATMAPPGVFAQLTGLGLDQSLPTLVVFEANTYVYVCMYACMCVCARARARARVCVCLQ